MSTLCTDSALSQQHSEQANASPPDMFLSSSVYNRQLCFHWLAATVLHSGFRTSAVAWHDQPCVVAR